MPIYKNENGEIIYVQKTDRWSSDITGVFGGEDFAVSDSNDPTKQIVFELDDAPPNSVTEIKNSASQTESIVLTLPAQSGTLALAGSDAASFTTIQTPTGTSPVATGPNDTLTLGSSSPELIIEGDASTDSVLFSVRQASATQSGVISSVDFNVFNSKFSSAGGTVSGAVVVDMGSLTFSPVFTVKPGPIPFARDVVQVYDGYGNISHAFQNYGNVSHGTTTSPRYGMRISYTSSGLYGGEGAAAQVAMEYQQADGANNKYGLYSRFNSATGGGTTHGKLSGIRAEILQGDYGGLTIIPELIGVSSQATVYSGGGSNTITEMAAFKADSPSKTNASSTVLYNCGLIINDVGSFGFLANYGVWVKGGSVVSFFEGDVRVDGVVESNGTLGVYGTLDIYSGSTSSAAAGSASSLPATPAGYVTVSVDGTPQKIPYYN